MSTEAIWHLFGLACSVIAIVCGLLLLRRAHDLTERLGCAPALVFGTAGLMLNTWNLLA